MWDTFTVRFIMNGIICKVGCQRIYFATPQEMCKAMEEYIDNPDEYTRRRRDTAYRKITEGCQTVETPIPTDRSDGLIRRPSPPTDPSIATASTFHVSR